MLWTRRRLLALMAILPFARRAAAEGVTVEIRQFKFEPAEIEIPAGGAVTFVNFDIAPHTATGDAFDTGTLRRDERKEITFPVGGEFAYLCKFHRHMKGKVIVR